MIEVKTDRATFCYDKNRYYIRWDDDDTIQDMPTRLVLTSVHTQAFDQLKLLVNRKQKLQKLLAT